jgi:hypothetical protein
VYVSVYPIKTKILERKKLYQSTVSYPRFRKDKRTYEIKVFPDHCVYNPIAIAINVRLLIPGLLTISHQLKFAASNSNLIVVSICAISAFAKTESRSPSAW